MNNEQLINKIIGLLSIIIFAFLTWLIYFKNPAQTESNWVNYLPHVNASLNTLTAIFLTIGLIKIKSGKIKEHKIMMYSATFTSFLFLISYVVYHHFHGDTKFNQFGMIRYVYFFILITHILLSIIQVPLILSTHYLAFTQNFTKHKAVARWTFPIWMYVSITGVLIFFFLNFLN